MTVKNEQNETIILTPEQEAIKRLLDKLKESEEVIRNFQITIENLKYCEQECAIIHPSNIQELYDFLSEYLSLKSYASTVVDLLNNETNFRLQ